MQITNEALLKGKQFGDITINGPVDGEYSITMKTQDGRNKPHNHTIWFTQNGINALVGCWRAVAMDIDSKEVD